MKHHYKSFPRADGTMVAGNFTIRLRGPHFSKPERTVTIFKRGDMPVAIESCQGKEGRTLQAEDPKGLAEKVLRLHAELVKEGVPLVIELPERVDGKGRWRLLCAPLKDDEAGVFIRNIAGQGEKDQSKARS
jgi:hypothetical protein